MKEITNRYQVTFNEPEYNAEYVLSVGKSGSFSYGNGSCVTFSSNGKTISVIDTRYDINVLKNFDAWCNDFLTNYFNPDLEPKIKKIK